MSKGLGVALVTPFKEDLSIDYEALGNLISHVITGGVDYIVVLGTTAETPTLSLEEKNEVARFIRKKTDNQVPLVLGIGGNNTKGVINDILSRDLDGYSAILSVTPYYNKPTQEGLYLHFKEISQASPLPILLYNVPGRTGVNLSAATTLRLVETCPNICGIKEASGDINQAKEIIDKAPSKFNLVSGNDSDIYSIMQLGGKGVISVLANAFPAEVKKIVSLCNNRQFEEAKKLQEDLNPLIGHLFEDGNPGGVKALLTQLGLVKNILRLPLVPVGRTVYENLSKKSAKYIK